MGHRPECELTRYDHRDVGWQHALLLAGDFRQRYDIQLVTLRRIHGREVVVYWPARGKVMHPNGNVMSSVAEPVKLPLWQHYASQVSQIPLHPLRM